MPLSSIPLYDGHSIVPIAFGSGTAFYKKDVTAYVLQALDAGFRHIDTAQVYDNEHTVGVALQKSKINREDLYITTKYGSGDLRTAFISSLKKLGLNYVDLYLIHHPKLVAGELQSNWWQVEKLKEDGLAKSIGVSNFTVSDLKKLLSIARIKPAVNQVKFHPYNWKQNKELLAYATQQGIVLESYGGLTPITQIPGGPLDAVIDKIGKRLNASANQVIFSWIHSKGVVIVTTSSKKARLEEYLGFTKLRPLTVDEIAEIDRAGIEGSVPDADGST